MRPRWLVVGLVVSVVALGAWSIVRWWNQPPNLLILVADDLGVDKVRSYGAPGGPPPTPAIDALAAEGMRFTRAYAAPSCTPTRIAMLSGQYARRFGIGLVISVHHADVSGLSLDALTYAEMLSRQAPVPYATTAVGKWHVSSVGTARLKNPNLQGFDHYAGPLGNLGDGYGMDGRDQSYDNWEKTTDGELARTKVYVTLDNIDEAVTALKTMPEPWLLVVNFSAPHAPYHVPPAQLLRRPAPPEDALPREKYDAMVESVDVAVERVLAAMSPSVRRRTYTFFLGDNGTPGPGVHAPFPNDRAKTTLYEGGIHIPLVVTGPGVPAGSVSDALVSAVDLFPTLAELADVEMPRPFRKTLDGVSFVDVLHDPARKGARDVVYAERFEPNGMGPRFAEYGRTALDGRWKLIRYDHEGREELYDLDDRWFEGPDLLRKGKLSPAAAEAHARLSAVLDAETGPLGSMVRRR